jgi:hypothetical protein
MGQINFQHIIAAFMAGLAVAFALFGNTRLQGVVDQTLKNPKSGEWSRKNLTGFAAFIYSMYYCQDCMVRGVPIQEFVVAIYMGAALTCLGISSWEKYQLKPTSQPTP